MRVGLLGGTFDPVHFGHLNLANIAIEECSLDQVVFIPSAHPPHKYDKVTTSFNHRVAMLKRACEADCRFTFTTIEGGLPVPSYTVDTLQALSCTFTKDAILYFIIGVDAFLDLLSWKSHEELLRLVNIIIAQRTGFPQEQLKGFLGSLDFLDIGNNCWQGRGNRKQIRILSTIPGNFSSTFIRKNLQEGGAPDKDLPAGVFSYILQHQLYRS